MDRVKGCLNGSGDPRPIPSLWVPQYWRCAGGVPKRGCKPPGFQAFREKAECDRIHSGSAANLVSCRRTRTWLGRGWVASELRTWCSADSRDSPGVRCWPKRANQGKLWDAKPRVVLATRRQPGCRGQCRWVHDVRGTETAGAIPCRASTTLVLIARLAEIALLRHLPASFRFESAPWGAGRAVPGRGRSARGSVYRDLDHTGGCWRRGAAGPTLEAYGRAAAEFPSAWRTLCLCSSD